MILATELKPGSGPLGAPPKHGAGVSYQRPIARQGCAPPRRGAGMHRCRLMLPVEPAVLFRGQGVGPDGPGDDQRIEATLTCWKRRKAHCG